jgi:hypothetical protein
MRSKEPVAAMTTTSFANIHSAISGAVHIGLRNRHVYIPYLVPSEANSRREFELGCYAVRSGIVTKDCDGPAVGL